LIDADETGKKGEAFEEGRIRGVDVFPYRFALFYLP